MMPRLSAAAGAIAVRHSSFATANHRAKFLDNAIALRLTSIFIPSIVMMPN